jgi:Tol biopolymer transport system component
VLAVAVLALAAGVGRSEASRPTLAVGGVESPVWSPSGDKIAFAFERSDGTLDIEVLNLRTGKTADLTRGMGRTFEPAWSPDGRWLTFSGPDPNKSDYGALYLMRTDGSGRRLLAHQARESAWSPDGKTIVYWFEDYAEPEQLRYITPVGRDSGRVVIGGNLAIKFPFWSPRGTSVCFHSQGGAGPVYCINRNGQDRHVVLRGRAAVGTWSSDWRYVVYPGALVSLWTARLPHGQAPARLTRHGTLLDGLAARYATWSPDDQQIAFARSTRRDGTHASLYVIGASGANLRRVVPG